jgi:hypothetical protein
MRNRFVEYNVMNTPWPLEDNSIDCCITSPPYWGLRNYGVDGQLGLESTPEEYISNMVRVFEKVYKVLKPDGTLWLNIGDSYASTGKNRKYSTMEAPRNKPCRHPLCPDNGPCRKSKPKKTRTPLKRSKKRINPVSPKQAKRLSKYSTLRKQLFADDNICAVAFIENKSQEVIDLFKDCQYFATDYHHDGGKVGEKLFDMNGKKLCRNCHTVAETHPKVAYQIGLSKSRISK